MPISVVDVTVNGEIVIQSKISHCYSCISVFITVKQENLWAHNWRFHMANSQLVNNTKKGTTKINDIFKKFYSFVPM